MVAGALFALTLPGLVCLLVLLVALERFGLWARGRSLLFWRRTRERSGPQSLPLSGTGFEEVDAFFTGAKRAELEERHSRSLCATTRRTAPRRAPRSTSTPGS